MCLCHFPTFRSITVHADSTSGGLSHFLYLWGYAYICGDAKVDIVPDRPTRNMWSRVKVTQRDELSKGEERNSGKIVKHIFKILICIKR